MPQQVRVLAAFVEGPSCVLRIQVEQLTITPALGESKAFFWPLRAPALADT